MAVFSMEARGPASARHADALAEECSAHWRAGRQQCEEVSLNGNPCSNRKHLVPGQAKRPEAADAK